MALKDLILSWQDGVSEFDKKNYRSAKQIFEEIVEGNAKICYNLSCCCWCMKDIKAACRFLKEAISRDEHLVIAHFQLGVAHYKRNRFNKALQNFQTAYTKTRSCQSIDYTQLGLDVQLHTYKIIYNVALCLIELDYRDEALEWIDGALALDVPPSYIPNLNEAREAIKKRRNYRMEEVAPTLLFRPPRSMVQNTERVDYMGKAKVVASSERAESPVTSPPAKPPRTNSSTIKDGRSKTPPMKRAPPNYPPPSKPPLKTPPDKQNVKTPPDRQNLKIPPERQNLKTPPDNQNVKTPPDKQNVKTLMGPTDRATLTAQSGPPARPIGKLRPVPSDIQNVTLPNGHGALERPNGMLQNSPTPITPLDQASCMMPRESLDRANEKPDRHKEKIKIKSPTGPPARPPPDLPTTTKASHSKSSKPDQSVPIEHSACNGHNATQEMHASDVRAVYRMSPTPGKRIVKTPPSTQMNIANSDVKFTKDVEDTLNNTRSFERESSSRAESMNSQKVAKTFNSETRTLENDPPKEKNNFVTNFLKNSPIFQRKFGKSVNSSKTASVVVAANYDEPLKQNVVTSSRTESKTGPSSGVNSPVMNRRPASPNLKSVTPKSPKPPRPPPIRREFIVGNQF